MKYSNFAHPVVSDAIKLVESLEKNWEELTSGSTGSGFRHIQELIKWLARSTKSDEYFRAEELLIFRYFAASVIYSHCIHHSFHKSDKLTKISKCPLLVPGHLKKKITISYLNAVAKDIETELFEKTFFKDQQTEHHDITRRLKIRAEYGGRLASIISGGNIPYLRVFAGQDNEVYLRNGFEISLDPEESKSQKALMVDERIEKFPYRFFQNGSYQPGYKGKKKLVDIFNNDEILVQNTLIGKYITRINIHLPNYNQQKTIYEIDIADDHITNSAKKHKLDVMLSESFAGIERENISSKSKKYTQQDVLVTYFSSKLHEHGKIELNHEELDKWCFDRIESYFSLKPRSRMYIGFCYQTILDGRYSDDCNVEGSTNLLLLALTRGLAELYVNDTRGNKYQPASSSNKKADEVSNKYHILNLVSKRFFKEEEETKEKRKKIYELKEIKVTNRNINPDYLGATSRGITVKTKFPKVVIIVSVLALIWFIWYVITILVGTELESSVDFARMIGTFLEVISGEIAVVLLLLKFMFLQKWEFNDMLRSRRRARSLKELRIAIGGTMASAINLLASIPNPKDVFSRHDSCAFVDGGCGEFEIDENISTEDLTKAGYKFGVNYYGEPVVADTRAQIRSVTFPEPDIGSDQASIHIEGLHECQPKFIFELPTETLTVAGSCSSPFFETTAYNI